MVTSPMDSMGLEMDNPTSLYKECVGCEHLYSTTFTKIHRSMTLAYKTIFQPQNQLNTCPLILHIWAHEIACDEPGFVWI